MRKPALWLGVLLCAGTAGLAATAHAATSPRPGIRLPAATPPVRVWASADPAANAISTVLPATEQLSTYGRPIRVGHSTYWLDLDAYTEGPGSFSQLDVYLIRGRPGQFQLHEYSWLRNSTLTVNRRAMTARLDGGSISPSAIQLGFSPTHVWSHTCTLAGGGTGTFRKAVGAISVSAFRVATNTSPVFGTIRVRPRKALLWLDPGCRSDLVGFNPHPCPSSEVINAPGAAPSEWGAAVSPNGTHTLLVSVGASQTPTKLQHAHWFDETLPRSDLPPPLLTPTGATATFLTGGSLFATGVGRFTSSHAPRTFTGSCTRAGVHHTYRTTEYRGLLSPSAPPLIALFDTGHIRLASPTAAYLDVSHLTS
jgi:hypothetical protein